MLPRLALALLLLAPACFAGSIPVALHNGRLTATTRECDVQLGCAASDWEGPGSRAIVSETRDGFCLLFHLDVQATPYWLELACYCHRDGSIDLIGWEDSGDAGVIGETGCESYPSFAAMLKSREWLATDARACLRRCGVIATDPPR